MNSLRLFTEFCLNVYLMRKVPIIFKNQDINNNCEQQQLTFTRHLADGRQYSNYFTCINMFNT